MKPSAYTGGAFVVLLGLTTCSLLVTVRADPRDTYTKLCQDQEIDLRVSQIKLLVLFAKSPESSSIGCDPDIKEAIQDLEEPLEVDDPDNHCTVERVNRILGYLYKHIRAEEVSEPLQPIHTPKSLKRFFVGYALIVSKVCKLGMLKLLMKDTKQLIEKDDYSEVLLWTSGTDCQTKTFLGRAINYDDMFLVGSALCDSEIQTCRKLFVQNVYWERLRSMRNTCHRLFKPFYGQLIMPIVRLANAGIDYMDSELREKLDDFRENPELQKWFKVVFLCESLANVVPLPALKEDLQHKVEIDEEALKKLDEEETKEELEEKKQEADDDGEVVQIVNLNEECPVPELEDGNADKPVVLEKNPSTKDGVGVIEVVECQAGKKVLKVKKSKKFLSSLFGKESYIAKELRKLQQERKAYLLSKKSMPVTNIMTKRDVAKYEQENGPIDYGFGIEPPIGYRPKPEIHINYDLMLQTDKRVARAIKKYETKKREWRKILRIITKKYVRLLRRITLLGRVKFGGKQKQKVDTDELMFKVFDHAMWRKENPEMVRQEKGKWRKILEFQNLSNVATCVSLTLGVIFFILSCTLGLGR